MWGERERKEKICAVGREAERKNLLVHVRERGVFVHGEISLLERAAARPAATEGRPMPRRTVAALTRIPRTHLHNSAVHRRSGEERRRMKFREEFVYLNTREGDSCKGFWRSFFRSPFIVSSDSGRWFSV